MAGKMRALIKKDPRKGLWLEEIPIPAITSTEILIEVTKTAVCGTDLHIYNWDAWSQENIKTPITIGHEFVGRIKEVGDRVKGFEAGELVSGEGHITCGQCRNCKKGIRHLCRKTIGLGLHRNGAFAEYVVLPASNVFKVDESIPESIIALFDAYGNAVHTALSFDVVGEDVLITGAGPIGIMAAAICRHVGARHVVITDLNEYRLALANKITKITTVNLNNSSIATAMKSLGMQEGFDVCLEISGKEIAVQDIIKYINHGGKIAALGIFPNGLSIDWNQIIFKSIFIKGIYGREIFETWYKMLSLLKSGLDINPIVTHEFSYKDYEQAFSLMQTANTGKIILEWKKQ